MQTAWLLGLLERKPPNVVAVAVANKMARIAWAVMTRGGTYKVEHGSADWPLLHDRRGAGKLKLAGVKKE